MRNVAARFATRRYSSSGQLSARVAHYSNPLPVGVHDAGRTVPMTIERPRATAVLSACRSAAAGVDRAAAYAVRAEAQHRLPAPSGVEIDTSGDYSGRLASISGWRERLPYPLVPLLAAVAVFRREAHRRRRLTSRHPGEQARPTTRLPTRRGISWRMRFIHKSHRISWCTT